MSIATVPTSFGGPFAVCSPAIVVDVHTPSTAVGAVTNQFKNGGILFGVTIPGVPASGNIVGTNWDGSPPVPNGTSGQTYGWCGAVGGLINLLRRIDMQVVVPGTTTPCVISEVSAELGLAVDGRIALTAYDISGNVLASVTNQFFTYGSGPNGRSLATITGVPGIAYFSAYSTAAGIAAEDAWVCSWIFLSDMPTIACPIGSGTAIIGVPFASNAPVVSGGVAPYTFFLDFGPDWMTIDSVTGIVSGTPTDLGDFTYEISVSDAFGGIAFTDPGCDITVTSAPPPPIGLPCDSVIPHPATDVQFRLEKIMATIKPDAHLPVRGSVA